MVKSDQLTQFIRRSLDTPSDHIKSFEDVVFESVAQMMADLMAQSHLPYPQLELIQEHLMEDAWDILRKMTYGCFTLEDYHIYRGIKRAKKKVT
ncbi:MAG: hypothetical protein NZ480_06595 [Bdellovibrionaceae bacterium]|nr:hypothetical protein [Pseudobdellovibrionaceae bacterium]MDW8190408.1 hypothetical protein [Pseudobdellovibrionaceae bacterium]